MAHPSRVGRCTGTACCSTYVKRCSPPLLRGSHQFEGDYRTDRCLDHRPTPKGKGTLAMHPDPTPTTPTQEREALFLMNRAWFAYLWRARRTGEVLRTYSRTESFVRGEYIVLRSLSHTLAVFQLIDRS